MVGEGHVRQTDDCTGREESATVQVEQVTMQKARQNSGLINKFKPRRFIICYETGRQFPLKKTLTEILLLQIIMLLQIQITNCKYRTIGEVEVRK